MPFASLFRDKLIMNEAGEDGTFMPGHESQGPAQKPDNQPITYFNLTFNTKIPVLSQPASINPQTSNT